MSDRIEFGNNSILEGGFITVDGKTLTESEYRTLLKKRKEADNLMLEKLKEEADKIDLGK